MHKANSPDFHNLMVNFTELHAQISSEKPYYIIFTGDFNAHSVQWWPDGDSNNEGTQFDILFSELGLTQMISEPTHFREHCHPSCIDLIICDQPNLVIDSGVRQSLDNTCKHQITFCKLSIRTPNTPPFKRLVWFYDKANRELIKRAMTAVQWGLLLNKNPNPYAQVKLLNQTILNIITNFVPSSTFSFNINEPKWITRERKKSVEKTENFLQKVQIKRV